MPLIVWPNGFFIWALNTQKKHLNTTSVFHEKTPTKWCFFINATWFHLFILPSRWALEDKSFDGIRNERRWRFFWHFFNFTVKRHWVDFRLQISRSVSDIATSKNTKSQWHRVASERKSKNVFDTQNPFPLPSSSNRTHERHNTWTSWKVFNLKVTK